MLGTMKKIIYITAFTVLGVLVQFLLHALIEVWYIELLVRDFPAFGLGLSWDAWFVIHAVLTVFFLIGGASVGYFSGRKWWRIIYIEQRYKNKKWPHWNLLSKKD